MVTKSRVLLKKLSQACQAGIHFLFAPARFRIQIGAAARTETFAVLRAEMLGIHCKDKYIPQKLVRIQLFLVEKDNLIAVLLFQLRSLQGRLL